MKLSGGRSMQPHADHALIEGIGLRSEEVFALRLGRATRPGLKLVINIEYRGMVCFKSLLNYQRAVLNH